MISNINIAKPIFSIYLVLWIIILISIILMLIISNGLNAILLTTYLMFFLIFTLGFNYIKILNIDMSGLGITYISQPYFFKIINSRIMQKRYEIDFNSVEKINVENEYLNKKFLNIRF